MLKGPGPQIEVQNMTYIKKTPECANIGTSDVSPATTWRGNYAEKKKKMLNSDLKTDKRWVVKVRALLQLWFLIWIKVTVRNCFTIQLGYYSDFYSWPLFTHQFYHFSIFILFSPFVAAIFLITSHNQILVNHLSPLQFIFYFYRVNHF